MVRLALINLSTLKFSVVMLQYQLQYQLRVSVIVSFTVCSYSEVTLPVAVSVKNRRLNRSVIAKNIVPPEHSRYTS